MQADSPLVTYVFEASNYGGAQDPNIVCIHDVEAPLEDGYARSLTGPNWFGGPAETSAHYVVGPDDICQGVPENRVAWHCGTGNPRSIAIEQCGYASFTSSDWGTAKGLVQQENVSRLLADINRRRSTIRLRWLSNAELRAAWNNPGSPGGVVVHDQMRATLGGTTHHDPFNGAGQTVAYPLQSVIDRAVQIRDGGTPTDWFDMATKEELRQVVAELVSPQIINDVVAGVLRAPEFSLSLANITGHRQEDGERAVTRVLQAGEPSWLRTDVFLGPVADAVAAKLGK